MPFDKKKYEAKTNSFKSKSYKKKYVWFYGHHACISALNNSDRNIYKVLIKKNLNINIVKKIKYLIEQRKPNIRLEIVSEEILASITGKNTVHQGVAIQVSPMEIINFEQACRYTFNQNKKFFIIALDQITDPQNIGAIIRSSAALGAKYLFISKRNVFLETGTLAKIASGGLEKINLIYYTNLSRSLTKLKTMGWKVIGLDTNGNCTLSEAAASMENESKIILVCGGENKGLRRLTKENCDLLACIQQTENSIESLNTATAAAIGIYELLN